MSNKLLIPKKDYIFQALFSDKNIEITKYFIEDLIDTKIHNIKINNTKELSRKYPDRKLGILDLEAEINNNQKIDIEIQISHHSSFINRILFYNSKLFDSSVPSGFDGYSKAKKTIVIAIIDFELPLLQNNDDYINKFRFKEISKNFELTDMQEICIIELSKIRKLLKENKLDKFDNIIQWMLFLDNPNSRGGSRNYGKE